MSLRITTNSKSEKNPKLTKLQRILECQERKYKHKNNSKLASLCFAPCHQCKNNSDNNNRRTVVVATTATEKKNKQRKRKTTVTARTCGRRQLQQQQRKRERRTGT